MPGIYLPKRIYLVGEKSENTGKFVIILLIDISKLKTFIEGEAEGKGEGSA